MFYLCVKGIVYLMQFALYQIYCVFHDYKYYIVYCMIASALGLLN
jgi:hypothetical protein